jgi:thiamine pyrophosphate-dependent acetolactate synthase large subunit-like protein
VPTHSIRSSPGEMPLCGPDVIQDVDLNEVVSYTDLHVLFQDVTAYVYTVSSPTAMRHVVDRAVRSALWEF